MRKLAIALGVTAGLLAGSCAEGPDAGNSFLSTVNLPSATKNYCGRESRATGRPVRPWLAPRLRSGALLVRALLACQDGAAEWPPDTTGRGRRREVASVFFGG